MAETDKSTQKGGEYEQNGFKLLKKYGLVSGAPAGAKSDIPDLQIKKTSSAKTAGLELKMMPTAAGGLVMQYVNGKWQLGDTGGKEEKEFLAEMGRQNNILKLANSKSTAWGKNTPYLQYDRTGNKIYRSNLPWKKAYEKDIVQYGGKNEIHVDVKSNSVISYYNSKDCYYMNVGTHGFYLLGSSDPLGLNAALKKMKKELIPVFSFPVHIRCRCQSKGSSSGYNFNMVLTMSGAPKSPYNLLPINRGSGTINLMEFKKEHNQTLLEAFGV